MILSNGQAVPTTIDTIADRTPLFADASYYPNTAIALSGTWAAYGAMYRHQVWVNTVVRKLAFGTARLPFEVKRINDSGHEPEQGPLADLMARPNDRLDAFRLWVWTSATYDIYGEAFWLKLRDENRKVRELHPVHPSNMIYRRDPETGEPYWIYATGVRDVSQLPRIPVEDVVPFLSYNPEMLARGLSNLEPLRQTLLNEDASRRAIESWWRRGARPSLMISAPNELSDKAYERLKSTVDRVHAGADNAGGTIVLEQGAKPEVVQLNAEEMQYIESRKLNREEVCAAYDMPPPVVHILDKATFSNITEQMRSQYRDTMPPRLEMFESVLAHHLVPDFYPGRDVVGEFNLDEVLRGDFEKRGTAVATLIEKAVLTPNEGRAIMNLSKSDDPKADLLFANAALQELGRPAERVTITANAPASPGETADANEAQDAAAQEQDAAATTRAGGTRTVVDYAPVRRGGRPPKSIAKESE
jgi:HK97 family phage portal protein